MNASSPANVLIFPGGTGIGLEMWKSLRYAKEVRLFGASSIPSFHEQIFERAFSLPSVTEDGWLEAFNELVRAEKIDFVLPAHDTVLLALAEAQDRGELACHVVTSPIETCRLTRSKSKTYEAFRDVLRVPITHATADDAEANGSFPFFLKPDAGQGTQHTTTARTRAELDAALAARDDLLLSEHLPGKEYTIDCFSHRDQGLLFCEGRERTLVRSGISSDSVHVDNPSFREFAEKIAEKLTLHGAWFFQLKEDAEGDLALLEIAPRLGGTSGTHRATGMNFSLMSLYEAEGAPLKPLLNHANIRIRRTEQDHFSYDLPYDTVYCDFDDCLIVRDRVNLNLLSFLYQARERGKRIVLLTRHRRTYDEDVRVAI